MLASTDGFDQLRITNRPIPLDDIVVLQKTLEGRF